MPLIPPEPVDEPGFAAEVARAAASASVDGVALLAEDGFVELKTGTSEGGFDPGKVLVCCAGFAAVDPAGAPAAPGAARLPLWLGLGRIGAPGAAAPTEGETPVAGAVLNEFELVEELEPMVEPVPTEELDPADDELEAPPDELPPLLLCPKPGEVKARTETVASAVIRREDVFMGRLLLIG